MKAKSAKRARPIWKGMLRFGLVSIPVEAYTAKTQHGGRIDLDWLHRDCHNRIRYQKVCPVHGEVAKDEIVSGYKYGKRGYVVIEPDELQKLRGRRAKTIDVDVFIPPDALDRRYDTERSYYLLPEGETGARPYVVFQRAMAEMDCFGIAQVVLFRREQIVLIRALGDLLLMTALSYHAEFHQPEEYEKQLPSERGSAKERQLAHDLIEASMTSDFDFAEYEDPYAEQLMQLIEAKAKGREIEVPTEEEEPVALDFAQALRQSLEKARRRAPSRSRHQQLRHRKVS